MFREIRIEKRYVITILAQLLRDPTIVVPLVVVCPYIYESLSPRCVLILSLHAHIQADLELSVPNMGTRTRVTYL